MEEVACKVKKGKSFVAFICGAAVAAVVTLLTAPASGKTTRKRIRVKARKAQLIVTRNIHKVEHQAERNLNRMKRDAFRTAKQTGKVLAKRAQLVRHAASEKLETARDRVLHVANGHSNGHKRS